MNQLDFIRTWNESESLTAFCEKTGIANATARTRASYYRTQKGVSLKMFPRGGAPYDWEKAREVGKETNPDTAK